MEIKHRYVIQNIHNGHYFADTPERKTKHLWNAKRFPDEEYYRLWLQTSPYAVDPNDYEFFEVEMTIKKVGEESVQ